jgi:hypothetical protein
VELRLVEARSVHQAWVTRGFAYLVSGLTATAGALGFGFYYMDYSGTLPSDISNISDSLVAMNRWMIVNAVAASGWLVAVVAALKGALEYMYSPTKYLDPKSVPVGKGEEGDEEEADAEAEEEA